MHIVVITLTVIVALLLIGIVLIQKSKGGGLSSQFGGAGSVMGVRQTSFLEKATWTLLGLLILLSIISAFTMPKVSTETRLRTIAPEAAAPALPAGQFDTPVAPVAVEETEAVAVEELPAAAEAPVAE